MAGSAFVAPVIPFRPQGKTGPCLQRRASLRRPTQRWAAVAKSHEEVVAGPFQGHYGQWNLTRGDVAEVNGYRLSLAATAIGCAVAYAPVLGLGSAEVSDAGFALAYAGLGRALWLVHIYMVPLHKMLKGLWVAGGVGSVAVGAAMGGLVSKVVDERVGMLGIGWGLVAMTGLFFKEAFCFGRPEAIGLTLLTPIIAAGHFLGLLGPDVETPLVGVAVLLMGLFAAAKFTRPVTDDLGDKSVFEYFAKQESR